MPRTYHVPAIDAQTAPAIANRRANLCAQRRYVSSSRAASHAASTAVHAAVVIRAKPNIKSHRGQSVGSAWFMAVPVAAPATLCRSQRSPQAWKLVVRLKALAKKKPIKRKHAAEHHPTARFVRVMALPSPRTPEA